MAKLTDMQIRNWIKAGERFEARSDGDGLVLCWSERYAAPFWKLRYKFAGIPRTMTLGNYSDLPLAKAREAARELRAKVSLGHDVAGEKQERKAVAVAKIEEAKRAEPTVSDLAEEFYKRMIEGRVKHPQIVRARIDNDIAPTIGHIPMVELKPMDVDTMIQAAVARGAPTIANDALRYLKRMYDFAIKRHYVQFNPAAPFNPSDAGGQEKHRERALSLAELRTLLSTMKTTKGFSRQNELTVKLLLMLAVRKQELCAAPWAEFDLPGAVWHLPAERTKTGEAIDIPLPPLAVACLQELHRMAAGSDWVLPARKMQTRMIPHIHEGTINVALSKVKHGLEPFTVHDFRRTARTQLAALGIAPHVAESCLNHKLKGVEGIYNRYDYFAERKAALNTWADLLASLEHDENNVVPIRRTV
jgi:integrase